LIEKSLTENQLNEIEKLLKDKIENDENLKGFDKIIFLHTLSHEMGHLRMAMKRKFYFGYIRVNRYIVYRKSGSEFKEVFLDDKILDPSNKTYQSKKISRGQCVVFASETTPTMAEDYIAVLSAGPAATALFKKDLEISASKDEIKQFYWDCFIYNIEKNPNFLSPELPFYFGKVLTRNSDQNLIIRLKLRPKYCKNLNERFRNVYQYMTNAADTLPNNRSYNSMRAVCKVIRENEFDDKVEAGT